MSPEVRTRIEDTLKKNKVVLFMKGNKHFPQCGFSAQVVQILNQVGAPYSTVNVLTDPAIRDGIKEFAEWPTLPQLSIAGESVGGCDIVKDMHAQGDLAKALGVSASPAAPEATDPPVLTISDEARRAFLEADEGGDDRLRLEVDGSFAYDLFFGPRKPGDFEVVANGVTILVDRASAPRANGMSIAWVETPDGGAFRIENPNEPASVKSLGPRELAAWIGRGEKFELFDVRTAGERDKAKIADARHLDAGGEAYLRGLDKGTTIVFHCHHGMRSRVAAERFLAEGFRKVYNLEGGIDAWSQTVDPKVPRY